MKLPSLSPPLQEGGQKRAFYIVGMGGSAGSLESFEQFFRNVPVDSGMAFVVVSHLDPGHKDILPELLQRLTTMKVSQANDGAKVQPNSVYVIPPGRDLSILHGTLHLEDILPKSTKFEDCLLEHDFPGIGHKMMLLNARWIGEEDSPRQLILLAIEDLNDRRMKS
jgi:hypothetical protein